MGVSKKMRDEAEASLHEGYRQRRIAMRQAKARSTHTPGPWHIKGSQITAYRPGSRDGQVICTLGDGFAYNGPGSEARYAEGIENANLIASAPALFDVVNTVAHWQPTVEPEQAATSTLDRAIYAARAALGWQGLDSVEREAAWRRGFQHMAHECRAESTGRFCRDCGKPVKASV